MPNPCWGKLIFVRLYVCLFTEILICTFKPIFNKKCSSPNPCHQELYLSTPTNPACNFTGIRLCILATGSKRWTCRACQLNLGSHWTLGGKNVGGCKWWTKLGGFQVSKFIQEIHDQDFFFRSFVSFLSSKTIWSMKARSQSSEVPLRFGDVRGSTWNKKNTNMGPANMLTE